MFYVQINDSNGKHFRKYTIDTLQAIYDTSPTAASFEIMVLIEGLVFLAIYTHYLLNNNEQEYHQFVNQKYKPSLGKGIKKLEEVCSFDDSIISELRKYQNLRNDVAHDLFRFKGQDLTSEYSFSDKIEELFNQGLETLKVFAPLVVPNQPNQQQYFKNFNTKPQTVQKTINEQAKSRKD